MNTHTRSMIQPRPNLRRVPPLDPFEREMIDMPVGLPPPDGLSLQAWLWVAVCAVGWVALAYWLVWS